MYNGHILCLAGPIVSKIKQALKSWQQDIKTSE